MSSTSNFYAIPPPPLTIIGGTTETVTVTQPQIYTQGIPSSSSSSSSSTSSIVIVIIVIASAIIVSASVYLLLRLISRRFHRSFRTFSAVDDVIPRHEAQTSSSLSLFASLPLFTFGSINGKVNGGDCAVCLSKFELEDQLRLLPVCCHAFHARCIDTWLESNQTCPLCRSTVVNTDADVLNKALYASVAENGNVNGSSNGNSFRLEIGSISRRREPSTLDQGQRSYSIGSFDYIVDDGYEVSVSDCTSVDKDSTGVHAPALTATQTEPPGDSIAAEVASSQSWLRDYVDRALSFRSSGRFFTGSSRRTDEIVMEDLEANRIGDEIGELFRWFSGV